MPNAELTHITIVLDRSGSMDSVRDDAIGGFNTCVGEQKKLPGAATLTLVQFDHAYEVTHRAVNLEAVPVMTTETFVPRGRTALYDAIGRAVAETAEYVQGLAEDARPAKVVVAILTDGRENASRELDHEQIQKLLKERTAAGWDFWFLGANLDVARTARAIGVDADKAFAFESSPRGTRGAFSRMSDGISSSRSRRDPSDSGPKKVH
jgi:hypothetical protein